MNMLQQRIMSRSRQRGMSFFGVVLLGVVVIAVGAIVAQSVPVFVEYMAIQKAVKKAAGEVTVQNARASYHRTAIIENLDSLPSKDLEITSLGNNGVTIEYSYEREIKLFGPAYLVYRFNGSSTTQ